MIKQNFLRMVRPGRSFTTRVFAHDEARPGKTYRDLKVKINEQKSCLARILGRKPTHWLPFCSCWRKLSTGRDSQSARTKQVSDFATIIASHTKLQFSADLSLQLLLSNHGRISVDVHPSKLADAEVCERPGTASRSHKHKLSVSKQL